MLRFGICTRDQYDRAAKRRDSLVPAISYKLLEVDEEATGEEIEMFEYIHFWLRTSNGTFRTTFRNRFRDVDVALMQLLRKTYGTDAHICVQDRAASHALTSSEWAEQLFKIFPYTEFEASDLVTYLFQVWLPSGETYIVEPDGEPLQWISPPFVVNLCQTEPLRYPLNRVLAARARKRFERLRVASRVAKSCGGRDIGVTSIACVHPMARLLAKRNSRFRVNRRSVFEHTPGVDVLRTMNILNRSYFSERKLRDGITAAFNSLNPGGIWIVGRTFEHNFSNHVTFFRKHESGWEVLLRIGGGWEAEDLTFRMASQDGKYQEAVV